jgi:hypothetical protein
LKDRKPAVSLLPRPVTAEGAVPIDVTLRNRENIAVTLDEVRVVWPLSVRVFKAVYVNRGVNNYGEAVEVLDKEASGWRRRITAALHVNHAGAVNHSSAGRFVVGDTHSETFLFRVSPSIWSRAASIFLRRISTSSRQILISFRIRSEDRSSDHIIRRFISITPTTITVTPTESA